MEYKKRKPNSINFTTEGYLDNPSDAYLDDQKYLEQWKIIQDIVNNSEKVGLKKASSYSNQVPDEAYTNPASIDGMSPDTREKLDESKSKINEAMQKVFDNHAIARRADKPTNTTPTKEVLVRETPVKDLISVAPKTEDINPIIKDYLINKSQDKVTPTPKIEDPSPWVQFGAHFGDALAGRGPAATAQYFDSIREKNAKVNELADLKNPMSQRSINFRKTIEATVPGLPQIYGDNWEKISAADQEMLFKPIELKQKLEMQNAQLANAQTVAKIREEGQNSRQDKNIDFKESHPPVGKGTPKQKTLSDSQVTALTDLDNSESQLNNILSSMKNNYVGPLDGRVPDIAVSGDEAAFRSAIGKFKDSYRKAVTGAGASEKELKMLESRLPDNTDNPEQFRAKALEAIKEIQMRRENFKRGLEIQNKDTSKIQAPPAPPQQSSDEEASIARQKRIQELRAKAGK